MYQTVVQRLQNLPSSLVTSFILAIASVTTGINSVAAQQSVPTCQSPTAGEYVLLVISPTPDNQKQLRSALPNEIKTSTCRYLSDTVTRIGGFKKIDDANRWARFVSNVVGLSAIITTRPTDAPSQRPPSETVNYKPQALGEGYAVLVDYMNRPELANQVQQVVGGDVGFVSYGQRPYLLATYTSNQKEAYNRLQSLTDRGFFTILVDSRKVMLLRSVVRLQQM
jgi:hypothetical protein